MATSTRSFLINRKTADDTLRRECAEVAPEGAKIWGLDGFDTGGWMGFIHDGEQWECQQDSLMDEAEALEWANEVAGYGEHVGLFHNK